MQPRITRAPGARSVRLARFAALGLVALSVFLAACGGGSSPTPAGSITPAPSVGRDAAMEALEKTIPTEVGDVALSVGSGDLSYLSDKLPAYDQLVARLSNAGIVSTDVIVAAGRPADGGADPTVAGLSVLLAPPGGLGLLGLMQAWTSEIPGATTENTNIGGKPVVVVSFSDGSAPLYYYLFGDSTMYWVRTADAALAEDALTQLP